MNDQKAVETWSCVLVNHLEEDIGVAILTLMNSLMIGVFGLSSSLLGVVPVDDEAKVAVPVLDSSRNCDGNKGVDGQLLMLILYLA